MTESRLHSENYEINKENGTPLELHHDEPLVHAAAEIVEGAGFSTKLSHSKLVHQFHKLLKPAEHAVRGHSFLHDYKKNRHSGHSHFASIAGATTGFGARGITQAAALAEATAIGTFAGTGVGALVTVPLLAAPTYTFSKTNEVGETVSGIVADAIDDTHEAISSAEVHYSSLGLGEPDVLVPREIFPVKKIKQKDLDQQLEKEKSMFRNRNTESDKKTEELDQKVGQRAEQRSTRRIISRRTVPVRGAVKVSASVKKDPKLVELESLLMQSGMSSEKRDEVTRTLNTIDVKLTEIRDSQIRLEELKNQDSYIQAFQGLDKFSQTIAKIGIRLQSRELVLFAGGLSSISEIGTGLAKLGNFSGTMAEVGLGAIVSGGTSIFSGVIGLGFSLLDHFMREEQPDLLGEALQTISQQIREVHTEVTDVKHMLYSGLRHLSEMMFHLSKGLEQLSEQQRQTFELARRGFQVVQTALQDIRIENNTFHQRILADLGYLIDIAESKELSHYKQEIQECVDLIRFHLEQKESDKSKLKTQLFKLRSKIKKVCATELNGATEFLKLKHDPRQAAGFLLRRLSNGDDALGFLAEEFERITKKSLSKLGIEKDKLFCSSLWVQGATDYLELLSQPTFQEVESERSLKEVSDQSNNVVKFMSAIGQSKIIEKLLAKHDEYLHELQLLILSRMNAKKTRREEKETKDHQQTKVTKHTLKEYFSNPADRALLDELLYKIDYNYLLINRFVEIGGFVNKKQIVGDLEYSTTLWNKSFNFTEIPTTTVAPYYDLMEPAFINFQNPIYGYNVPNYQYINANLEIIGGHKVKIDGKDNFVFMSCGVVAPYSWNADTGLSAGSVTFSIICHDVVTNKVSTPMTTSSGIPSNYKLHTSGNADWAWASSHVVTLADNKPYFVFFTGGSGHVAMFDLEEQKSLACDNSKPFSFSVPMPSFRGNRFGHQSTLTTTCYTHIAFNRVLMIHQVDWQSTPDYAVVKYYSYDLENRRRIEYQNLSGMEIAKTCLKSPNQLFFQTIQSYDNSDMTILSGLLVPGDSITLGISSRKFDNEELSLDTSWTYHADISIPIQATEINQVRSETIGNNQLIVSSIKTKENSNKLVVMFGNYEKQDFSHFECDLPPIHEIADWQTLRTTVFSMGGKSYAIATLLDPNYKSLVFLIDPEKQQIMRLADGPQLEFRPSVLDRLPRVSYYDAYLSRSRRNVPGMFPVNGYAIHVSEHEDMLTLHFSYANSNGMGGSIELATYNLAPKVKSELDVGLLIDVEPSKKEIPDNALGLSITNIQTLVNSTKTLPKPKELPTLSLVPDSGSNPTITKSPKMKTGISTAACYGDDLNKLFKNLISTHNILNELINDLKSKMSLLEDIHTQINISYESINKLGITMTSNGLNDIEAGISSLNDVAQAFNMLNILFKTLNGYKYTLAKEVSVLIKEIHRIVTKIEKSKTQLDLGTAETKGIPKTLSTSALSLFSLGRGFDKKTLAKLNHFLMTLGIKQSAISDGVNKVDQLNTMLEPHGICVEEVARDGNCFYRAAADLLNKINKCDNYTHGDLRKLAAKHVIDNIDFYRQYIPGNLDSFIAKGSEQGKWAEDIMPHALARALNCNIVIINSDQTTPIVIKRAGATNTLSLGYEVGAHYNSLVMIANDDTRPGEYLSELLDAAPIDDFNPIVVNSETFSGMNGIAPH